MSHVDKVVFDPSSLTTVVFNAKVAMSVETLLERALSRVTLGWAQNSPAEDIVGRPVTSNSPHAVAWSLTGALGYGDAYCLDILADRQFRTLLYGFLQNQAAATKLVCQAVGYGVLLHELPKWNDDPRRTRQEVMNVLRMALVLRHGLALEYTEGK